MFYFIHFQSRRTPIRIWIVVYIAMDTFYFINEQKQDFFSLTILYRNWNFHILTLRLFFALVFFDEIDFVSLQQSLVHSTA